MSDTLRQLSDQLANRKAALENQISDAKNNIQAWEKELSEVEAAAAHIDSKLPPQPVPAIENRKSKIENP
jgi:predicted  nucleic acid-binding Zn-ribbon protein